MCGTRAGRSACFAPDRSIYCRLSRSCAGLREQRIFENGLFEALLGNTKLEDRTAAISWTMATARGDSGIRIGSERCLRSLSLIQRDGPKRGAQVELAPFALKAASVLTLVRIKNSNMRAAIARALSSRR